MKPWSLLPNAHLIDWVLASLKTNPEVWHAARGTAWNTAHNAVRTAAAWNTAHNAAHNAALNATYNATYNATWTASYDAASYATWDAILALIAYDDCERYLSMSYEKLLTYAILSEKPQALLLLPLKWIQENETMVTDA